MAAATGPSPAIGPGDRCSLCRARTSLLIDIHSMPPTTSDGRPLADIVLGDLNGLTRSNLSGGID